MQAEVELKTIQEIGLQMPDGTLIFPPNTWHGRPLATPEDRKIIVDAIATSASNLGMSAQELMGRYHWVVRNQQVVISSWHIEAELRDLLDSALLPVEEPEIIDTEEVPVPPSEYHPEGHE